MAVIGKSDKDRGDLKCSFCDENPAVAHWSMEVFVCRECAKNALPQLMADALVGELLQGAEPQVTNKAFLEAQARFWQSAFIAACSAKRTAKELKEV